jgi:transcriptional regulator of acetoin/glycerol metabolism
MELFNPYFYAANIDLLAYENAWIQYMESGEKNENVINRDIYDSWDKSSSLGVDPFSQEKPAAVDEQELERRLRKNRYVFQIVEPSMEILFDIINESEYAVILSDREGVIIRVMCGPEMKDICSKINLHEGADYRLESVGTSSINMAIELKKPVQITGCQHYRQIFQHYTSSSAPVLTESGGVLCVLSVLGKYEQENEHTLGMIHSITKGIESQHHINKINRNLKKRNNQLEKILSMVSDSIVYTENRKIIQVNGSMLKLIGKDESEVIGRNVYDTIVTQPSLAEFFADEKKASTGGHVLLIGKNDSYKCIVSTEEVNSGFEKSSGGRLIRFTQIKTIEMMASKMRFAAKYTFEDLIGESDAFSEAITVAKKASAFDSRVIITGESGTGKEMFAQAIHNNSSRKAGPFVAVDCGAIPHELFESEFFGYEKGAFTGARREGKEGLVEKANNGTLFLDEIGNMSLDMQIKLLRVLQ